MCGFFGAGTYAMKLKKLARLERQAESEELKDNSTQVLYGPLPIAVIPEVTQVKFSAPSKYVLWQPENIAICSKMTSTEFRICDSRILEDWQDFSSKLKASSLQFKRSITFIFSYAWPSLRNI